MAAPAIAAGITAGAMLLGQLMSQEAKKRREARQAQLEGMQKGLEMQAQGQETIRRGSQDALGQLMAAYKAALL